MPQFIALAVTALVCLAPAVAGAQPCPAVDINLTTPEQAQVWWMVLLDALVQLSIPLLTAVLGVLSTTAVRKLTRKWDAEKQESAIRLTENLVVAGVAFAEEQARKALRVHNIKTSSAEKLQRAVDFVHEQLDQSGLPGVARAELMNMIESKLQQERSRPDGVVPGDNVLPPLSNVRS